MSGWAAAGRIPIATCLAEINTSKTVYSAAGMVNSGYSDLTLRITDPALLSATGGIVQGMSGSPLVQDGKLVGAVTHVLVGTPAKGYGIFADTMLKMAETYNQ